MLNIQRVWLNASGGGGAWVEIKNLGPTPAAVCSFCVRASSGEARDWLQGAVERTLDGLETLRLTDGTAQANPRPGDEPRDKIEVPGLDLSAALGGSLVLQSRDSNGHLQEDAVGVPALVPTETVLIRHPTTKVMTDRSGQRYH
jgi:hypothetical protein